MRAISLRFICGLATSSVRTRSKMTVEIKKKRTFVEMRRKLMRNNSYSRRKIGMPAISGGEAAAYGEERYWELLQQAEQHRLERQALEASSPDKQPAERRSPISQLLAWVGIF
jgi:hypothetical protein